MSNNHHPVLPTGDLVLGPRTGTDTPMIGINQLGDGLQRYTSGTVVVHVSTRRPASNPA
jgi:hypothetical protein